jgi:hypothetical protein
MVKRINQLPGSIDKITGRVPKGLLNFKTAN